MPGGDLEDDDALLMEARQQHMKVRATSLSKTKGAKHQQPSSTPIKEADVEEEFDETMTMKDRGEGEFGADDNGDDFNDRAAGLTMMLQTNKKISDSQNNNIEGSSENAFGIEEARNCDSAISGSQYTGTEKTGL